MTEWIDPKEFKRLWCALIKAGWKARPPSGLDTEHTYDKAGEQCVFPAVHLILALLTMNVPGSQVLWVYAKLEGLIQSLLSPPRGSVNLGRLPI
ncbi:Hypothetical protein PHPALM_18524 [Phytophthora palmivora]|uniref:Uncharacterized protein n=1 Tax=Phytophthora palmivora TaxID=4796 RepID=A0A2P4XJI8_9STRA|nr:Hypothetical protein PHPALM_18524 [Phytophthora palmivora]